MEITKEIIAKFDEALSRGLCSGLGDRNGQMCVEAALCYALGESHSDFPSCVPESFALAKQRLNDANWSSSEARANGMRAVGIAQLGSKEVVDELEFFKRYQEKTIRVLLPMLALDICPNNISVSTAALKCETEGSTAAAYALSDALWKAAKQQAAAAPAALRTAAAARPEVAAVSSRAAAAPVADSAGRRRGAASVVAAAAYHAQLAWGKNDDKYLLLSARLMLECFQELGSPGCEWL